MQEIYRFIDDAIEADRQRYTDIADQIWDHPETRFEEFWSAEHLASALESAGFTVTRNVGNIPNAFIASFGQGKPVIALLGEYDALAGLSQQAGCAQPISATPGENGHGCGHNLLGTAAFAAAIAVKKWLEQYGQGGTVRFYGCPGEEGGSGKTFMVREGVFDDVDAALTWHPEAFAGMFNTRTLANIQASWRFKGIAAHAANSPHLGRSALDAVTLMTTGTNFLNEHIIEKARVHYAITNSGGISPNVVQAQAEVLYLIRAPEMTDVQHIYDRVAKIAEGAALMTETTVECRFDKACSSYLPNRTLENAMYRALSHFGTPEWNSEELAFAKQIQATLTSNDRQNSLNNIAATGGENGKVLHYVIVKRYWRMKSLHMPPPITCLQHRQMSATSVGNCLLPSVSAPVLPSVHRYIRGNWLARGEHLLLIKECYSRRKLWLQPQSISSLIQGYCKNANKSISKLRTRNRITALSRKT